jgi:hypothetical protein
MKLSASSADLVFKLALVAGAGIALWYLVSKAASAASDAAGAVVGAVGDTAWAISPTNQDNVIYQTANAVTGGTADRPIGVRIYDFFHPNQ